MFMIGALNHWNCLFINRAFAVVFIVKPFNTTIDIFVCSVFIRLLKPNNNTLSSSLKTEKGKLFETI